MSTKNPRVRIYEIFFKRQLIFGFFPMYYEFLLFLAVLTVTAIKLENLLNFNKLFPLKLSNKVLKTLCTDASCASNSCLKCNCKFFITTRRGEFP